MSSEHGGETPAPTDPALPPPAVSPGHPEAAPTANATSPGSGTGVPGEVPPGALLAFLAAIAAGGLLRFYDITRRPLHHDEGVNALFLLDLVRHFKYRYDPSNYHGPLLYFMVGPLLKLIGERTVLLRLWPAILGTATIAVFWPLRRLTGVWGAVAAAWLLALSPIHVYFSRDGIHESWYVAACALIAGAAASYVETRRPVLVTLAWAGVALLFATKETAPIVLFAFLAGLAAAWLLAPRRPPLSSLLAEQRTLLPAHAAGLLLAAAILVLLFTSFFSNPKGFIDLFRAYAFWTKTGTQGAGHEKPWPYFFDILWRYERLAWVLGGTGIVVAALRRERAIAIGTVGAVLLAIHSVIPYKTPWLILVVLPWLAGSAGYLVDRAVAALPGRSLRIGAGFLLPWALVPLGREAWRVSFVDYDDDHEAIVYSQTRREFLDLVKALRAAAAASPQGKDISVDIMSSDHFPLNWYLRDLTQVAYWGDLRAPRPGALILIAAANLERFRNSLDSEHMSRQFPLRPGVELQLLIPRDVFERARAAIPGAEKFASALPAQMLPPLAAVPLPAPLPGLVALGHEDANFGRPPTWVQVGRPIHVDYDFGGNHEWTPPFGIEWVGYLQASREGLHRFALSSDDGSKLEVDGHLVIENWDQHPVRRRDAGVRLEPGWHRVRLLYTDYGGGAKLSWLWTPPEGTEEEVPASVLAHAVIDEKRE